MVGLSNPRGGIALSAAENKQLMQSIYAALAKRDGGPFMASLSDDVTLCVTGQESWSRTFYGKTAVLGLYGYVRSLLVERSRMVAHRFIADGDWVAIEARGDNLTKAGGRYDNDYCFTYRLEDGKIVEIREYCDTALTEAALGVLPAAA
jgi:ketosteroid isomerase-like protein